METPEEISFVICVSITGPNKPPPTLNLKPREMVAFNSLALFELDEFSFVKLKVDPFSMVAELFEPGGSRNTKSGNSGPAVTNVWEPSATPPNTIPCW